MIRARIARSFALVSKEEFGLNVNFSKIASVFAGGHFFSKDGRSNQIK